MDKNGLDEEKDFLRLLRLEMITTLSVVPTIISMHFPLF